MQGCQHPIGLIVSKGWSPLAGGTRLAIKPERFDRNRTWVNAEGFSMHKFTHTGVRRPLAGRWRAAVAGVALGLSVVLPAKGEDTIKVGILHSLSGTMAISETTLKDVMLMLIEEQNKKGGLLGKKLEA